jgi:hypothetical protein
MWENKAEFLTTDEHGWARMGQWENEKIGQGGFGRLRSA